MPDLDDDLLVLLSDVSRHMRTYADQLAQTHGMTRAQLIILARLQMQPDLTQNELAALAEVAPMTIAKLIDRPGQALRRSGRSAGVAAAADAGGGADAARDQELSGEAA
jgi:hypothetical protein